MLRLQVDVELADELRARRGSQRSWTTSRMGAITSHRRGISSRSNGALRERAVHLAPFPTRAKKSSAAPHSACGSSPRCGRCCRRCSSFFPVRRGGVGGDPAAAQEVRDEVGIRPWPVVIGIRDAVGHPRLRALARADAVERGARFLSSTTVGRRLVTGVARPIVRHDERATPRGARRRGGPPSRPRSSRPSTGMPRRPPQGDVRVRPDLHRRGRNRAPSRPPGRGPGSGTVPSRRRRRWGAVTNREPWSASDSSASTKGEAYV